MLSACQIRTALLAESGQSYLPDQWLERLAAIPPEIYIAVFSAGFTGLLFGWIMGRSKTGNSLVEESASNRTQPELQWRHEKLALIERQDEERQRRLTCFLGSLADDGGPAAGRARWFAIAEGIRESRRRVGSDLSRFSLVAERLSERISEGEPGLAGNALPTALEIAESQRNRLEELRDGLRPLGRTLAPLDESISDGRASPDLRNALEEQDRILSGLTPEWRTAAAEAEKTIRDLLGSVEGEHPDILRHVLLVDGAVSDSLGAPPRRSLRQEVRTALDELNRIETETEAPEESSFAGFAPGDNPFEASDSRVRPSGPTPDPAFRAPVVLNGHENSTNGNHDARNGIDPKAANDVGCTDNESNSDREAWVVFRSNDPSLWGKNFYAGANRRARSFDRIPDWAEWISISRTDTGETVFAPTTEVSLPGAERNGPSGFHGNNDLFYGARHLGMFSETVPNQVETRFTYGGWGFGHRVAPVDAGDRSAQASGWAGEEIPADTVFEIAFHATLPELSEKHLVLAPEVAAVS